MAGKTLRDRRELTPPAARARGDAGNRRLHNRWINFNLRRRRHVIADVAVTRELAGWRWSLGRHAAVTAPTTWLSSTTTPG
ncbi:MAG: hypothetical protein ACRDTB_13500 [Actinophytocola sp.]